MCLHVFIASIEEKFIFPYDFLKIFYFGSFPLGNISVKVFESFNVR